MEARLHALHVQAFHAARCAAAVVMTLIWCWAVFRTAAEPGRTGPVEQGLAVGGWTLSLLPVHVAPRRSVPPDAAEAAEGTGEPATVAGAEAERSCDAAPTTDTSALPTPRCPWRVRPLESAPTGSRATR